MSQSISNYFVNYEIHKLNILQPDLVNLFIIVMFIIIIATTIKRDVFAPRGNNILDVVHTDQLRGLCIFFVVLGHLWVHVSKTKPQFIFSGDAVSMFLLISGFGLAASNLNKLTTSKSFFLKRTKRVMIPYWIVTTLILLFDYIILDKTLATNDLLLTLLGINTNLELRQLDYVRWFITFILFWYLTFFIFVVKLQNKYSLFLLIAIAFTMLPISYYLLHFGWCQFFAFPIGCVLAVHYEKVIKVYWENKRIVITIAIMGIIYILIYKTLMNQEKIQSLFYDFFPNILLLYYSEANSLILNLAIIYVSFYFIEKGSNSKILLLLGKYSYEIFLLHGVFLIKYNPIIKGQSTFTVATQFLLLLSLVIGLSVLINKAHNSLWPASKIKL